MISIYTTEDCFYCKRTKDYLRSYNIPFTEYDVTDDIDRRTEMIEKSSGLTVPVIDDDGDIFVGFNKSKLDVLVKKYGGN